MKIPADNMPLIPPLNPRETNSIETKQSLQNKQTSQESVTSHCPSVN